MQSPSKCGYLCDCLHCTLLRLALVLILDLLSKPSRCILCDNLRKSALETAKCWTWRLQASQSLPFPGIIWTFLISLLTQSTPSSSPSQGLLIQCAASFHLAMGLGAPKDQSQRGPSISWGSDPHLCQHLCPGARAVLLIWQPGKSQRSLATRPIWSCC